VKAINVEFMKPHTQIYGSTVGFSTMLQVAWHAGLFPMRTLHFSLYFFYFLRWSGTGSTVTGANKWPIVSVLHDDGW
jgi:hypothetical protein